MATDDEELKFVVKRIHELVEIWVGTQGIANPLVLLDDRG